MTQKQVFIAIVLVALAALTLREPVNTLLDELSSVVNWLVSKWFKRRGSRRSRVLERFIDARTRPPPLPSAEDFQASWLIPPQRGGMTFALRPRAMQVKVRDAAAMLSVLIHQAREVALGKMEAIPKNPVTTTHLAWRNILLCVIDLESAFESVTTSPGIALQASASLAVKDSNASPLGPIAAIGSRLQTERRYERFREALYRCRGLLDEALPEAPTIEAALMLDLRREWNRLGRVLSMATDVDVTLRMTSDCDYMSLGALLEPKAAVGPLPPAASPFPTGSEKQASSGALAEDFLKPFRVEQRWTSSYGTEQATGQRDSLAALAALIAEARLWDSVLHPADNRRLERKYSFLAHQRRCLEVVEAQDADPTSPVYLAHLRALMEVDPHYRYTGGLIGIRYIEGLVQGGWLGRAKASARALVESLEELHPTQVRHLPEWAMALYCRHLLDPNDQVLAIEAAQALALQGSADRSISVLGRAYSKASMPPEISIELAKLYAQAGEHASAFAVLRDLTSEDSATSADARAKASFVFEQLFAPATSVVEAGKPQETAPEELSSFLVCLTPGGDGRSRQGAEVLSIHGAGLEPFLANGLAFRSWPVSLQRTAPWLGLVPDSASPGPTKSVPSPPAGESEGHTLADRDHHWVCGKPLLMFDRPTHAWVWSGAFEYGPELGAAPGYRPKRLVGQWRNATDSPVAQWKRGIRKPKVGPLSALPYQNPEWLWLPQLLSTLESGESSAQLSLPVYWVQLEREGLVSDSLLGHESASAMRLFGIVDDLIREMAASTIMGAVFPTPGNQWTVPLSAVRREALELISSTFNRAAVPHEVSDNTNDNAKTRLKAGLESLFQEDRLQRCLMLHRFALRPAS